MSAYFAHCSRHFRRIFPQNDELDSELLIASPIEWLSEIGVVTVLVITVAAETRFDSLDTAGLGAADYPVGGGRPAFFRSMKVTSRFCAALADNLLTA